MNTLKVLCAQFRPQIGNVSFNLDKIASFFQQCQKFRPDVIVLPELCGQGMASPDIIASTAEPIPGNASDTICEFSKNLGGIFRGGDG